MTNCANGHCANCGCPLPLSADNGYLDYGACFECGAADSGVPNPDNWNQLKETKLAQVGYRCEWETAGERCNARHEPSHSVLDLHHRVARRHREAAESADQDIHGLDNLVILCRHHHNVETAAERDLSWHDFDPEDLAF